MSHIPNVLRIAQVRVHYNVPRDRLYRAVNTGELPVINVGTPRKASYLILRVEVEAWLERLTVRKYP